MSLHIVAGDPLLTHAQTLAFGYNMRARVEYDPFITELLSRYPAAFATYRKQAHAGKLRAGTYWLWTETQPRLMFLIVRQSAVGATRLRFVDAALMTLLRNGARDGLTSLAVAPLGRSEERTLIRPVVEGWLSRATLPVVYYETYVPRVHAEVEGGNGEK